MNRAKLTQEDLEYFSDDLLDSLITEQAQAHFDDKFKGLGMTLTLTGHQATYLAIESEVNTLCVKVAEAAFAAGYEHGFGTATLEMLETLRCSYDELNSVSVPA